MSVVAVPASLIPPVPIRLRTTFSFVLLSCSLTGVARSNRFQPRGVLMFLRKRRGIFGCTVFIAQPMWDFLRRRRQETGSSFLLSESVSVVFVVFFFVLMSSLC